MVILTILFFLNLFLLSCENMYQLPLYGGVSISEQKTNRYEIYLNTSMYKEEME